MSIAPLLNKLQDLLKAHETLLLISDEKTDVLIEGNMEAFQKILLSEKKAVKELSRAENERQKVSTQYASDYKLTEEEVTVTSLIERLTGSDEQQQLEDITTKLVNCITELKRKEEMNRVLIQQSMQFVQFSLDVMNPNIEKMNYGHKSKNSNNARSTFDSQA